MIGRIPITDPSPVVSCGRWPARAVVGEVVTVVGDRLPRGPRRRRRQRGRHPARRHRRRFHPAPADRRGHRPVRGRDHHRRDRRCGGSPSRPGRTRSRPGGTPSRSRRTPARTLDELAVDLEDGARLLERALGRPAAQPCSQPSCTRSPHCATTASTTSTTGSPRRWRRLWSRRCARTRCAIWSRRRAARHLGRPAACAVRQLVRVLSALGRGAPGPAALRHLPHRRRAAAGDRRDGLRRRLPATDLADRRGEPQGPQQHADAGPGRSGLTVGDRQPRRRPRRGRTPTSAPSMTSTTSWRQLATWAWRSRSTSRCSARRTTRGPRNIPSGSPCKSDGSIAYAENPPKKYQDIYRSTSTATPRASTPRCSGWCGTGCRTACASSGWTTRTPSRCAFWERLIAEIKATEPDVLFLAEAFTRPPMMHTLGKIGFTQSYTYFTWRNDKAELTEYLHGAQPARPPTTCGRTSS